MDFLSCFDFSKRTSLYVHIPFCSSKCSYCAFYSKPGVSDTLKERYVEKLVQEIEEVVSSMDGPFYTAFIGGGNPGCLKPEQLEKICSAVCRKGRPVEFTTEMNPECLKQEYFYLFEDSYLNRLSMGVQSLDRKALDFLGRNTDLEHTVKGIELSLLLKEKYGTSLSYDLITCLGPWHDHLSDVKKIVSNYNPDHLSVYALTLEENTTLYNRKIKLPDSDEQYDILSEIWQYLSDCGYEHYEVSNFAKPGRKSLHNSVYWNYEQYVGLGAGSASTGFSDKGVFRVDSAKSLEKYQESGLFGGYSVEHLSKEEAAEEMVLMGLRHKEGLNLERLKEDFGFSTAGIPFGYKLKENRLCPTDEGLMLSDAAAMDLLKNPS